MRTRLRTGHFPDIFRSSFYFLIRLEGEIKLEQFEFGSGLKSRYPKNPIGETKKYLVIRVVRAF